MIDDIYHFLWTFLSDVQAKKNKTSNNFLVEKGYQNDYLNIKPVDNSNVNIILNAWIVFWKFIPPHYKSIFYINRGKYLVSPGAVRVFKNEGK